MPAEFLTSTPTLQISGQAVSEAVADRITEVRVELASGAASTARIRLREADENDAAPFAVGADMTVGVMDEDFVVTTVFTGVVTAIGIVRDVAGTDLVVDAFDKSYKLGQRSVTTSHLNVTPADVLSSIASDAGLTYSGPSDLTSPTLDFVQQSGTPHQFIDDLLDQYGCEWTVTGDGTLRVWARESTSPVALEDIRRFRARYSGIEESDGVSVRGWDPSTKSAVVGDAASNQGALNSNTVGIASASRTMLAPQEALSYGRPVSVATEATNAAKAVQRRMEAAVLTGRGEVDVNPAIVPGAVVQVTGVANEWDGEYRVTAAEHVFGHPGQSFVTRFTLGELGPTSLVDLLGAPPQNSTQMVGNTITIGVVDSVQDPDSKGRVRVKFPYMSDTTTSTWARVVHHGAGRERGWILMPEPDDEVVVAFEHGDLDRPVVIGGLYNAADPPKIADVGSNGAIDTRSFTSRNGHQLVFSDVDSPAEAFVSVTLADQATKLILAEDRVELIANTKPLTIKSGQAEIVLGDDGSITLKGTTIKLEATQDVDVSGNSGVKVKSSATMAVEGLTTDLKASAKLSVDGGGMTEIKGGMVKVN